MITTTYTCDRCKAVQNTREQFWAVRVQVRTIDTGPATSDTGPSAQWCRACVDDMGILPKYKEGGRVEPVPTIEDMIREVVREETR